MVAGSVSVIRVSDPCQWCCSRPRIAVRRTARKWRFVGGPLVDRVRRITHGHAGADAHADAYAYAYAYAHSHADAHAGTHT